MNSSSQTEPPSPARTVDAAPLARAVRFLLCLAVLGVSIFPIVLSLHIGSFGRIIHDLYENEALPAITVWVTHAQPALIAISLLVPAGAVATLFSRRVIGCLYALGGLVLVAIVEALVIYIALSSPLVEILAKLGDNSNP